MMMYHAKNVKNHLKNKSKEGTQTVGGERYQILYIYISVYIYIYIYFSFRKTTI